MHLPIQFFSLHQIINISLKNLYIIQKPLYQLEILMVNFEYFLIIIHHLLYLTMEMIHKLIQMTLHQ